MSVGDDVHVNITRQVEHTKWCLTRSSGHARVMPVTGNTWALANSCGDASVCERVGVQQRKGGVMNAVVDLLM